ncbi:MAG: flagellar basal-body MS-ring/collar protein FliF [Burkholderiales bacterium]
MKAKLTFAFGAAALIALVVTAAIWGSQPDYRVLFSNISDKDGGAIIAQLSQMNVPYKYTEGGGALMVPADKVHEARLKLASQGLPRGGNVGFEVMDGQKFGVTQFQEHVNYQRALEGELARSIQSLASVQAARVHLALPKQSVFLREQQKPSASVILTLHAGRVIDQHQVAGITHLISSSISDLSPKQVSILDQNGKLLSAQLDVTGSQNYDSTQLNYVREIEDGLARRVIGLLEPLVGRDSVRAQVSADLDFTQIESTAETFAPNQGADAKASVRSQTTLEANTTANGAGGVPGALSNLPAAPTSAPISGGPVAGASTAAGTTNANNNGRRESVTNYEVDKMVRRVRNQTGTVKRVTAAVLINHRKTLESDGKVTYAAINEAEMAQIQALVREAIGFNKERGDSINIVNAPFSQDPVTAATEIVWWKDPANVSLAKELGKGLALMLGLLVIVFGVIRPAIKGATSTMAAPTEGQQLLADGTVDAPGLPAPASAGEMQVEKIREIAKNDPAVVANVVRQWVGSNG